MSLGPLLFAVVFAGWRDDFSTAPMHERWRWQCPVPGPTVTLGAERGWVRVTVPQRPEGYNHWAPGEHDRDAPMFITDAPSGDFDFEARVRVVRFGPNSNFHAAMIVGFSPGYVLAWGPFRAPILGHPKEEPELWCEPTGMARFIAVPPPARDLYLRIEKRHDTYSLLYSWGGTQPTQAQTGAQSADPAAHQWTKAGEYHAFAAPVFLGFMGKTFAGGEEVVFDVDYAELAEHETEAQPSVEAMLTVVADGPTWPLNERRFSHFIEHMHRCIQGGLWAEKLHNRKFTGSANGGVVEGWEPVGKENAQFSPDNAEWYVPCQSQRIRVARGGLAGITQGPIGFAGSVAHRGYVVAKSRPAGALVQVAVLSNGRNLGTATLGPLHTKWGKYEFLLPPFGKTVNAEFRITVAGPATVWLGAVSLMPADNRDGWRRDVLETVKMVRPPTIRWPGGNFASQYDWRDGIGERDRRPPRWNRAWNHWEWNDVGTDEFLRLCELLGAEPYICANAGEGSAREAAEWVEYCNGPPVSPMGRLRADNGHPRSYDVKLWGLGNEMYGDWQHGHLDATKYAIKAAEMATAMRAIDKSLHLVLVGVEGDGWGDWNRKVVTVAGRHGDFLSVHHYTGLNVYADQLAEYARAMAAPVAVERMLTQTWELARQANGGHELPLCLDEWNVWRQERDDLPGYLGFYCLREGLFAAEIFNALGRLGPRVPIACVTQTINVLGLIRVNDTSVAPTPSYWVLKLFRDHDGSQGLPVEYSGPVVDLPGAGTVPTLDASAAFDPKAERLTVFIVNRAASGAKNVAIRATGMRLAQPIRAYALTADSFLAANDYAHPKTIVPRAWQVTQDGDSFLRAVAPAHSLVVVQARTEKM